MDELIAQLEAATGPSATLDMAISRAIRTGQVWTDSQGFPNDVKSYTSSIDDALSLKPDGFQAYVDTGIGMGHAHACIWTDHPHRISAGARQAANPAIALSIAALKLRAAVMGTGQQQ